MEWTLRSGVHGAHGRRSATAPAPGRRRPAAGAAAADGPRKMSSSVRAPSQLAEVEELDERGGGVLGGQAPAVRLRLQSWFDSRRQPRHRSTEAQPVESIVCLMSSPSPCSSPIPATSPTCAPSPPAPSPSTTAPSGSRPSGPVLAAYVCVLRPRLLGESTPTILGLRTMALAQPADTDVTVPLSAVLDRLARAGEDDVELPVPPVTVTESWAGIGAPRTRLGAARHRCRTPHCGRPPRPASPRSRRSFRTSPAR